MATRTVNLMVGATYQCRSIFLDQNSKPILPTPSGTTYVSSTPATATVDSNGKVIAVAAGTTTITATNGSLSAVLEITVSAAATPYVPVPSKMNLL